MRTKRNICEHRQNKRGTNANSREYDLRYQKPEMRLYGAKIGLSVDMHKLECGHVSGRENIRRT